MAGPRAGNSPTWQVSGTSSIHAENFQQRKSQRGAFQRVEGADLVAPIPRSSARLAPPVLVATARFVRSAAAAPVAFTGTAAVDDWPWRAVPPVPHNFDVACKRARVRPTFGACAGRLSARRACRSFAECSRSENRVQNVRRGRQRRSRGARVPGQVLKARRFSPVRPRCTLSRAEGPVVSAKQKRDRPTAAAAVRLSGVAQWAAGATS